jgi:hypothetical protein
MALTWFAGVLGMRTGFQLAIILRNGTLPDVATAAQRVAGGIDLLVLYEVVKLEALFGVRRVAFPLAIAQTLLAGLLVIASGLAMSGRRGSRALALQALAANALLIGLAYALTRGPREAGLDAVVRAASALRPGRLTWAQNREVISWIPRIWMIAAEIGALALGALALTRARVKTYFEAVARATESAEEP